MDDIAGVIFQDGKNSSNAKNLHNHLRIWLKKFMGCVHNIPSTNSFDYINIDQKYMMYYLSSRTKMNITYILFKYLRELVKETRNETPKPIKWIPLGRLISDILFESKMVKTLIYVGLKRKMNSTLG